MATKKTKLEGAKMERFTIPARHLKAAMLFQAKNEVRPFMSGIHLNKAAGRIEATNGSCLITLSSEEIKKIPKSMIIRLNGAVPASAVYAEATIIDDNFGVFEFSNMERKIKKKDVFDVIDWTFIDVERALPKGDLVKTEKIGFNPEYIALAGKAASALGSRTSAVVACFRGPENAIELSILGVDDDVRIVVMPCRL